MRLTDYFLVIPDVPLMIVIAALFGRSTWNIIVIIGIIYWTFTARLIRAQTKSVRERVYVQRARALGARNSRLILRHVLPQVTPLLVANTVLLIAYAIFAETFITFLGLGDPSTISWGRLIENAFTDDALINEAWWAVIPPGVCVMLVVLACTIIGQTMEDALNPRLRTGHLSVRRFRVLRPSDRAAAVVRPGAARGRGPQRLVRPAERQEAPRRPGRVLLGRAGHEARHGRRVGLREDDDDPRADGAPAADGDRVRAVSCSTAPTCSRAERRRSRRTAGRTSRWSSRAR